MSGVDLQSHQRLKWRAALLLCLGVATLALACSQDSDFPDPSDPVSAIPWPDYELARYTITDQTDEVLGSVEFEIVREGGEYALRVLFELDNPPLRDETMVRVRAGSLTPISYERHAFDDDDQVDVTGSYAANSVAVRVVENGEEEMADVETGEFAFDNDSSAWLWRSILFDQDAQFVYRSVNVPHVRSQLVRLRVRGQDCVATPAGDFLAWQLEVRPGLDRQTAWYAVDQPRFLVRWDLEPRRFLLREVVTERGGDPIAIAASCAAPTAGNRS